MIITKANELQKHKPEEFKLIDKFYNDLFNEFDLKMYAHKRKMLHKAINLLLTVQEQNIIWKFLLNK